MSSGSYFPVAVKEVSIPKTDGKRRKLGIPTVIDRIAQEVIKCYLEPRLEEVFSDHSYGYRPLKSSHQAVAQVKKNVLKYGWAIDMDIRGFFDNMSHDKVLLALECLFAKTEYRLAIAYWSIGSEKRAIELLKRINSEESNSLNEQAQKALESIN